jgi:hypothetical protein
MGGFLAGMGWTLTRSSFKVMAGLPLGWGELPRLMQPDILMHWLPGVIFALVLMGVTRYYKHVLVLPTMLLGAITVFHLLWWLVNAFVKVPAKGWFLEAFPKEQLWHAWNVSTITQVDWVVLAHHSGNMIALMIVLAIALLLNAAGKTPVALSVYSPYTHHRATTRLWALYRSRGTTLGKSQKSKGKRKSFLGFYRGSFRHGKEILVKQRFPIL